MENFKDFIDSLFDDDSQEDLEKLKKEREEFEAHLILCDRPLYPARQSSDSLESAEEAYYFLVEYGQKNIDRESVSNYFNFLLSENEATSGDNLIKLAFMKFD